jgi:protein disulfide-isomerase-like protein
MLRITTVLSVATIAMGIELTPETWETETAGKTVFLKFFAPWCGHCKAMKPAWDTLMTEYQDSSTVLVADVDCIGSGKDLCSKFGVQGFPSVKFGDPANLEDYKGGRDLVTLQTFTSELKPSCDVGTLENCSEGEKSTIATLQSQSVADLKATIEEEADESKAVETLFETSVKKLQAEYQGFVSQKETSLQEISTKYNIGFVKSVLNAKSNKKELKKDEL